jgi:hypothetical protein
MRRWIGLSCCLAASLALVLAGCQKKAEAPPPAAPAAPPSPPFKVTGMELGKALTADHRIATPMTSFGAKDTIYVVVASEGASKGTMLRVRWTYQDTVLVSADSQMVAPTGPAYSEFHVLKPTHWPKGHYAVAVKADTAFAGAKTFDVK